NETWELETPGPDFGSNPREDTRRYGRAAPSHMDSGTMLWNRPRIARNIGETRASAGGPLPPRQHCRRQAETEGQETPESRRANWSKLLSPEPEARPTGYSCSDPLQPARGRLAPRST